MLSILEPGIKNNNPCESTMSKESVPKINDSFNLASEVFLIETKKNMAINTLISNDVVGSYPIKFLANNPKMLKNNRKT